MSRNIPGQPDPGELGTDWLSRAIIPDLYPRQSDPFKPAGAQPPPNLPPDLAGNPAVAEFYADLTSAGGRPPVFQRAINYSITANTTPIPLINQQTPCEAMLIDVYSTAANSIFFGFSSGLTLTNGVEIRVGNPLILSPSNGREQWEIQKPLEFIAAILAQQAGLPAIGPYRAPRVVFDASDYFVIAAAATAVSVMLFFVPEQQ